MGGALKLIVLVYVLKLLFVCFLLLLLLLRSRFNCTQEAGWTPHAPYTRVRLTTDQPATPKGGSSRRSIAHHIAPPCSPVIGFMPRLILERFCSPLTVRAPQGVASLFSLPPGPGVVTEPHRSHHAISILPWMTCDTWASTRTTWILSATRLWYSSAALSVLRTGGEGSGPGTSGCLNRLRRFRGLPSSSAPGLGLNSAPLRCPASSTSLLRSGRAKADASPRSCTASSGPAKGTPGLATFGSPAAGLFLAGLVSAPSWSSAADP